MSGMLRLAALNGVALLGFAGVAALAAAVLHPRVAAWTAPLAPARRAQLLLAWAALPAVLATALVGAALWPSLGAALGLAVDHCPAHVGHVHLCLHHLPARGPGIVGALGFGAVALTAGASLVRGAQSARIASRLSRASSFELPGGVGVLESARPFALTVGWLHARVLVSTALLRRLTPAQLQIVVAHERAHAQRRDALTVSLARLLSLAHLPFVRRDLLASLTLACEQACDEVAACACGDRVLVAETIVAAERIAASWRPTAAASLAFGGGEVPARVESLLAVPSDLGSTRQLRWLVLALLAALAAAAPHVHHWTETFLDHLPH